MTMSHNLQTRYQVVWTSAFGAAANTFKIKRWQGGMYLSIISAIWRDPTDGFWLPTLQLLDGRVVAIGTHGSPDSSPWSVEVQGHQVSTTTSESGTQTSVTTTSVACQTSDEEQQQPLSLEELLSPISPAEESTSTDTGPSQLSERWLNEVMLAFPPQPFSPLPPILSPIRSPVDIVSQEGSTVAGSPFPPTLQREFQCSPLQMHPDSIDKFQILDVWSPTPVPPSPEYPDYLEDGVLSLCVYDEDTDFF
ncbi:hypothetical protein AMECASPLE_039665 [Ameca splendens]|uniref:Uncharacterized protein n=1 Tax=Ameca splendens TaxID=208324 RepID=A0ABV0Y988_9TELE